MGDRPGRCRSPGAGLSQSPAPAGASEDSPGWSAAQSGVQDRPKWRALEGRRNPSAPGRLRRPYRGSTLACPPGPRATLRFARGYHPAPLPGLRQDPLPIPARGFSGGIPANATAGWCLRRGGPPGRGRRSSPAAVAHDIEPVLPRPERLLDDRARRRLLQLDLDRKLLGMVLVRAEVDLIRVADAVDLEIQAQGGVREHQLNVQRPGTTPGTGGPPVPPAGRLRLVAVLFPAVPERDQIDEPAPLGHDRGRELPRPRA